MGILERLNLAACQLNLATYRNQKALNKILPKVTFFSLALTVASYGAKAASFEEGLRNINTEIWTGYIKPAVQIGLFIWFGIKAVMVFVQKDKETNWWELLGLLAAGIAVEFLDTFYTAIIGSSPLSAPAAKPK